MTARGYKALGLGVSIAGAMSLQIGCDESNPAVALDRSSTPRTVRVVRLRRGDIVRSIDLPATVRAWQEATLFAKVTGYLERIDVDKGDEVAAGAPIAEIQVPELLADRVRAQAEVEVAVAEHRRVSAARKQAPDLVVPATVDDANARQKVAAANLSRIETLLGFAKITAPFAGVITRRFVDPGAFIPAATTGAPQGAAIVSLANFDTVRVRVAVPESDVPFVRPGTPAVITVAEVPGFRREAAVTRMSYALDDATRTMLAEIDVSNPQRTLRPGMYATVRLDVERHPGALLLPRESLIVDASGRSLFVVDPEGKVRKVTVETGLEDASSVEVLRGVEADQPVVAVGRTPLENGQPVRVDEAERP